jgi:hypothetical protein
LSSTKTNAIWRFDDRFLIVTLEGEMPSNRRTHFSASIQSSSNNTIQQRSRRKGTMGTRQLTEL